MKVTVSQIDAQQIAGARVTVMGLGRFGGGIAAIRFFVERGANVTVSDRADAGELQESLEEIRDLNFELHCGEHLDTDFEQADFVVASPAVRRDHPSLQIARQKGATITSEIVLFTQLNPAPIVAVTGSNGKSTTTALLADMLAALPRTIHTGGNIGRSLLNDVNAIQPDDLVLLELSSFQLSDLQATNFCPQLALVTNFSENHLDWHTSLNDYRAAKQVILKKQSRHGTAVLNDDDPVVSGWSVRGQQYGFGLSDYGEPGVFLNGGHFVFRDATGEDAVPAFLSPELRGQHNRANVIAAACAAWRLGVSLDDIRHAAEKFVPLPHRLQRITTRAGRQFYNDSIATTPQSTIAALDTFPNAIVIVGGRSKGTDVSELITRLNRAAKFVVFIGTNGTELAARMQQLKQQSDSPEFCVATSLPDAVAAACKHSQPGDIVLLSPGFASTDWFRNFADRGRQFEQIVRAGELFFPDDAG